MAAVDPKAPPKMPSAADLARIPQHVRDHALVMLRLSAAAREARKRWYELRSHRKVWVSGQAPAFNTGAVLSLTIAMWDAELAQEQGAGTYRAQLAENNARPAGERWSPTVLGLWARCMLASESPA